MTYLLDNISQSFKHIDPDFHTHQFYWLTFRNAIMIKYLNMIGMHEIFKMSSCLLLKGIACKSTRIVCQYGQWISKYYYNKQSGYSKYGKLFSKIES